MKKLFKKSLSMVLGLSLLLTNFLSVGVLPAAAAAGTNNDPFTVAEAITIQDNRIATVQGYIVGQPTGNTSVLSSSFTGDTAIAIADTANETDTTKMLYVQLPSSPASLRADFGLKTNPGALGSKVNVTGNLTPYFLPHSGLKSTTSITLVPSNPISPKQVPNQTVKLGGSLTLNASDLFSDTNANAKISLSNAVVATPNVALVSIAADGSSLTVSGDPSVVQSTSTTVTVIGTDDQGATTDCSFNLVVMPPTIKDARDGYSSGTTTATVIGIVTYTDGKNFYIQDDTAGIDVYVSSGLATLPKQGDLIKASGSLSLYNGLLEMKPAAANVAILSNNNAVPAPKVVTINQVKDFQSQLVEIQNVTLGTTSGSNTPITDAANNTINIYKMPTLSGISTGDKVDVVAISSIFTNPQLLVGNASDITKTAVDTVAPVIIHEPVTAGTAGVDLAISAQVTDNIQVGSVNLFYRTTGQTAYSSVEMVLTDGIYTANIPGDALSTAGLEYYLQATDGTNTVTYPADIANPLEVAIAPGADKTGPEVTDLSPADEAVLPSSQAVTISAKYSDQTGVDIASVKILLDDQDITSSATIDGSGFSYTPTPNLADGLHSVKLFVADLMSTPNVTEKSWSFSVGKVNYNLYFGGLHSHTNLSDGQGTPEQAFDTAKAAGADFMAITDHSNWFDGDKTTKANLGFGDSNGDGTGTVSNAWTTLKSVADAKNDPGKFVAIGAFEMTWSGGPGHINTFNTAGFDTRTHTAMTLTQYYAQLAKYPESISQFNHPGTTFGTFDDFAHWTPETDAVMDLVEVGNGEGAVHSSGYFPSYQYYQMALDKGWHVAPSNNQDNHKGNWMAANDARTVILAPELTRDSLYDAIRHKRVYATEDKNLQVSYYLNGAVMGSSLSNPDKLDFDITFNDADATDKISKVSVIANNGVVVASEAPNTNSGDWKFSLDTNKYSFYYIRIDEADTDVAVTAPVWTGDVVPVGMSSVEVSQDPQVVNSPVDFTASVYNNGTANVDNAKVEFYKDAISPANKIGEQTIASIPASGTATAKITWTPTAAGNFTIYAQMTANVGGQEKTFSASVPFTAANPADVTQVVIDGGHYNAYVTGYSAGKMVTLTGLLKGKKFMPVITPTNHELTAADLQYAKVLILDDPQSKPTATNYSPAEIKVIQDFVAAGGSIIVTSRADYDEKGIADVTAHSAYQNNLILDAIGSNLRLNDDEVIDNTSNGGQTYRLYFDDYTGSKYHLTDNIPLEETYSAYSGCSVVLKNGGSDANVDWLVKGHDTTESFDSDVANDATAVDKGNVYSLAAEVLPNGSKVIVAGTAFFSDFETASTDNAYSNLQITNNVIDWLTAVPPAPVKTIAEVRVDANHDGIPDLLGQRFAVEGYVTAQSKAVGPNTAFFDVIYVQDETGGLTIHNVTSRAIPLGAKVRITGIVGQYENDSQIEVKDENTDVEILDNNPTIVAPKTMSTGDSMLETNEGWLVKVQGIVTRINTANGDNSIYVNDGSGVAKVYVNGYIGDGTDNQAMLGAWDPAIKVGDQISAIGLASEDAAGHRIRVRNTGEIVKLGGPVLQNLTITKPATKLVYTVGDALDLSGLEVTGTYSDNSTKVESVSAGNVTGFNSSAPAASQTLTITVNGKTVTYTVEIKAAPVVLTSIAITKPATKLVYTVGEALDLSGLEVTGTYSDKSTKVESVSAANVSGFNSSAPAASQTLTITVGGKTATYTVEIKAAPVVTPVVTPGIKMLTVTASALNLRVGPGTNYKRVGSLPRGTQVQFVATVDNNWTEILYNGKTYYMYSAYLQGLDSSAPTGNLLTVTASALNLRTGPGTNYRRVGSLPRGTQVQLVATVNNWSKVLYQGKTYYMYSAYLQSVSANGMKTVTVSAKIGLNVRSSASLSGQRLGVLSKGAKVTVLQQVGDWYKILFNNQYGYVFAKYTY